MTDKEFSPAIQLPETPPAEEVSTRLPEAAELAALDKDQLIEVLYTMFMDRINKARMVKHPLSTFDNLDKVTTASKHLERSRSSSGQPS